MDLIRTVLMAWLLAVLSIDKTAANQEVTAYVGENVTLQCSCSKETVEVIWQIGTTFVVNHFTTLQKKTEEPHDSYKNRSFFKLNIEKGECSLRLLQVSESDEKNFTCYSLDEKKALMEDHVFLKIGSKLIGGPTVLPECTSNAGMIPDEISVGASLSVVAGIIILAFIIIGILLMRRSRQRIQRMDNHLDPQSGLPIMDHSPV